MKYSIPLINHIQRVAVLSQVMHQLFFKRLMETVKQLMPKNMWSFIN